MFFLGTAALLVGGIIWLDANFDKAEHNSEIRDSFFEEVPIPN